MQSVVGVAMVPEAILEKLEPMSLVSIFPSAKKKDELSLRIDIGSY